MSAQVRRACTTRVRRGYGCREEEDQEPGDANRRGRAAAREGGRWEELAEEFGTSVQSQRLWLWARRENNTYRPYRPLSPKEEKQSVIDPLSSRDLMSKEDLFVYLKLYDPVQTQLRSTDAQMKIQALEDEIVMLKLQDRCEKEAKEEWDQLKLERDTAVRQVDELRYQNRHIVLDFSLEHLQQATDHFSDVWKVGDTEYGCVYKCIIHKNVVALKLSRSQSLFQREVGSPNCILRTDNSPPLLWYNRAQIIAEVCCMMQFLHSNKPSALVHGDLRPCNILINANYRSKLCHFGMSDLFLEPGTCPPNMSARLPYMDPEFLTTWELTPLSDVYSLGAIILRRLLTGMPPLSIAKKVAAALKSDSLHLLIEKSAGDWPYTQAEQLALLGLRCVKMSRERRPDLSTKVWKVIEPMIMKPPVASWPCFQVASEGSCGPAPAHFFCPILKEIMNDPQVAADGFTYEAEGIRHWLDEGNNRSPMTNMALPNQDLIPNRALRSWIQEYLQQQKQQQGRLDS
uniref:RING-type E3 ubiquitin transferase n=1 Tax=Setaria viridis TaxID=4556 RepID=A0A4U6T4X7_SETVI|nr:hypothetical protein SEVIR_9G367400v2 [Setaria viridis]